MQVLQIVLLILKHYFYNYTESLSKSAIEEKSPALSCAGVGKIYSSLSVLSIESLYLSVSDESSVSDELSVFDLVLFDIVLILISIYNSLKGCSLCHTP